MKKWVPLSNWIFSFMNASVSTTEKTHKEGYLRAFFNKVKAGTDSSIKRCFITGVSPVTMDDLTSGSYFGYIADCLKRYASQRDKQKGECRRHYAIAQDCCGI